MFFAIYNKHTKLSIIVILDIVSHRLTLVNICMNRFNDRRFESITRNLILRGELKDLYDSDKWEFPLVGKRKGKRGAKKPRYKNHRT